METDDLWILKNLQIGICGRELRMKFIKIYAMTLVLCYVFVFFGGWMLFDFSKRVFVATAACAFIIAVIISIFIAQDAKIEHLEKRIKELEEKGDSAL